MRNSVKRGWLMLGFGLAAVPLSAAAIAYACTGLATVASSTSSAAAGATVLVTGSGFAAHDPSDIRTEPAKVRFDSPTGDVIATASPTASTDGGKFSVQITVPALAAGDHVLIVTQNGSNGSPAYGTPARQAFAIVAPAVQAVAAAPAAAPVLAPIDVPVLSQPFGTSAREIALNKAIAGCRSKFSVTKAKTKRGKSRMTKRRASCIKAARTRYA